MGSFYLVLGLVFSLVIAIVAVANNETVTVSYIFGHSDVSLILLILGSAFAGALAMGLFALCRGIRSALVFRRLRNEREQLDNRLKSLEEEKLFLEAELNRCRSVGDDAEIEEPDPSGGLEGAEISPQNRPGGGGFPPPAGEEGESKPS